MHAKQNADPRRVVCACAQSTLLSDPTASNEDAAALLRRCRRLYILRSIYSFAFFMEATGPKNAAPLVTGV